MNDSEAKRKARRRALRAAQAVTLGLAIATGGAGCFGSHGRDRSTERLPEGPDAAVVADAAVARDAGRLPRDAGRVDPDAGLADAGPGADAGICDASGDWMAYEQCCLEHGWDPEWGCFAWGPFVPPAERAALGAA